MGKTNEARLIKNLGALGDHPLVGPLQKFLLTAADDELFHIDISRLADLWGVSRRTVLDAVLRAVHSEVLTLEWVFHCPTCGGVAKESLQLAHVHEDDYCPVCRVDFHNTLDQNVEVFFSVSPEIRIIPDTHRHGYESLIVQDINTHGRHVWERDGTVKGFEVLTHPVFRAMFGNDTLPLDQSLEIRSATILFSDVTGSTAMYERLGDARAYRLIRDHFSIVFDAIGTNDGVPIKTIGDEVMGVFADEVAAVRAAFEMQDALSASNRNRNDGEELTLKIGVHRGPVIVVTLNNRIDYFGRTVNIAARTQAVSEAGQLSMGEAFIRAPGVRDVLRQRVSHVRRTTVAMKGIQQAARVYRVALDGSGD